MATRAPRIAAYLSVLLASLPLTAAAAPKSLSETPLNECTPRAALGWMYGDSLQRQADNAKETIRQNDQLMKIVNALPKSNRPVIELMTPAQAADFSQLSAQILIHSYNDLAESRLQRDIAVIEQAVVAIEKLQKGDHDLKTKDDPGADGAGLVGLLREAGKSKQGDVANPTDKTCTLDLAMFMKQQQVVESLQKLAASKEAADMKALNAQYHQTQLDPSKLPSPDREKAIWLQKAVGEPIARGITAVDDWENLRRFARVSGLRYTIFRESIIQSAGAKDYDYNAGLKKAYAAADEATQRTFDAYAVIDENIPAEATKQAKERANKIIQQSSSEPHN